MIADVTERLARVETAQEGMRAEFDDHRANDRDSFEDLHGMIKDLELELAKLGATVRATGAAVAACVAVFEFIVRYVFPS